MAGITLAQAQAQLDAWLAASLAVASGQKYSIGDRALERADLAEINKTIERWQTKVNQLTAGRSGIRMRGITPV